MSNKITSFAIVYVLVIAAFFGFVTFGPGIVSAAGMTFYVDDDNVSPPWDGSMANPFQTINDAITAATDGDTIYVFNGTYVENVLVDKSLSLIGNGTGNTTIDGGWSGDVVLITTDMVNITGFTITQGQNGIYLDSSSNCTISNNNVTDIAYGIYLDASMDNNITDNNVSNSAYGIWITESNDNIIKNNNMTENEFGVRLGDSLNCQIQGNDFIRGGVMIWGGSQLPYYNTHDIPTDNMVNGNPLYYYKDASVFDIDGIPVGQVILANCSNVNVMNLDINYTNVGIQLAFTNYANIIGNNMSNGYYGFYAHESSNINIMANNISNTQYSIYISDCSNINVSSNTVVDARYGIYFTDSAYGNIIGNDVSSSINHGIYLLRTPNCNITDNDVYLNNQRGIYLSSSSDNNIIGNTISSNLNMGIEVYSSSNANISGNTFINDGLFFWGGTLPHFNSHTVPTSNTVNGKPLYYYKDTNNLIIDGTTMGQLILANCNDANVANLEINDTDVGIQVVYCLNAIVSDNNLHDNDFGLYYSYSDHGIIANNEVEDHNSNGINFFFSDSNLITGNNVTSNSGFGIYLSFSHGNNITDNNASWDIHGIYTYFSNGNTIDNNTVSNSIEYGMYIYNECKFNIITNNTAEGNDIGIYLIAGGTTDNLVAYNTITGNSNSGVHLNTVWDNTISDNKISYNNRGIGYANSDDNIIINNTITYNANDGIHVDSGSTDNTLSYNTIANNTGEGILVSGSSDKNVITYNGIYNNTLYGISITSSNNNTVHHNNIAYNRGSNDTYNPSNIQAMDDSANFWDSSSKGNWWADWTMPDIAAPFGIVDNPYVLDGGSGQDNFPLVVPVDPVPPVISNLLPLDGSTLTNNLTTISADYMDPAGINENSVLLEVDDINVTLFSMVTPGDVSYTPVTPLADGLHIMNLSVADIHDNIAFVSWSFTIDTASPMITNLQPTDNAVTNDNGTVISANYTDLSGIDVGSVILKVDTINVTSSAIITVDGITYSPGTPWTDGPHTIELWVNDTYSNQATLSWSFIVDTTPPEAITDLAASDPTTDSINLTWTAPGDDGDSGTATEYEVRYSTSGAITDANWNSATTFSQSWTPLAAGETETYTISGLDPDTQYWFAIRALDEVSNTADVSNSPDATTLIVKTAPTAPENLELSSGDSYVQLTWDTPSDYGNSPITNYIIYRGETSSGIVYLTEIGNVFSYNDTTAENGNKYYYKVSAKNTIGEGPQTNHESATPATIPSAPQNLQASAGVGYVEITWDAPTDDGGLSISNYRIYRGNATGQTTFLFQLQKVLLYNDTSGEEGVTYYYIVRAKNALGEGIQSTEVSGTPASPPNQLPISGITSLSAGQVLEGTITISGTASDLEGTLERVEMKIDDGSWITVTGTDTWSHNLDTTTLSNGDHTIHIRSYDGTDYSAEDSVTIEVNNPKPKEDKTLMEEAWFFPLIIVIIIVIIIVMMLAMRKKAPAEGMPEEEDIPPEEAPAEEETEEEVAEESGEGVGEESVEEVPEDIPSEEPSDMEAEEELVEEELSEEVPSTDEPGNETEVSEPEATEELEDTEEP